LRAFGLQVIKLINLIRFFGFSKGLKAYFNLLIPKGEYFIVDNNAFKNKIYLRKDQSDPLIFEQVFCEQQYHFPLPENSTTNWIIDAGANIGLSAIYFSEKFPSAKIICIEPSKENFNILLKNTSNYTNIQCINAALWYKEDTLNISNKSEKSAGFMIESNSNSDSDFIKSKTINQLITEHNIDNISILKIDIEGSEKEIFEMNTLPWMDNTSCIICELHDWLKPGTSKAFFKTMSNYDWITYIKGENIICIKNNNP